MVCGVDDLAVLGVACLIVVGIAIVSIFRRNSHPATTVRNASTIADEMVYHYTDVVGMYGIWNERAIRPSRLSGQDARWGEGIYFTALTKQEGKTRIILNNYDGTIQPPSRTDYVIAFKKGQLNGLRMVRDPKRPERSIYLLPTREPFKVDFSNYRHPDNFKIDW